MKPRQLVPISSSNRILNFLNEKRGLSDPEIARMIGVRANFIGMVRLGELPLNIEQVETMAEAFGMRVGAFLLSMRNGSPKSPTAKRWATFCEELLRRLDDLEETMERTGRSTKQTA